MATSLYDQKVHLQQKIQEAHLKFHIRQMEF